MDGAQRYAPVLVLPGCRSSRLITYLKALGLARVVSQHGGRRIATRWLAPGESEAGAFAVGLRFSLLTATLLYQYRPSPVLSPWRWSAAGAPMAGESDLEWLAASEDPRLAPFRAASAAVVGVMAAGRANDPQELCRQLHGSLALDARRWLRAAEAQGLERADELLSVLSGPDCDVAARFLSAVHTIFDASRQAEVELRLRQALVEVEEPVGTNPWDVVLAVEGVLAFACDDPLAADRERGFGSPWWDLELREFWAPLWFDWACYSAVEPVLGGGAMRGGSGRCVHRALEVAMALAAGEQCGIVNALECYPLAASRR